MGWDRVTVATCKESPILVYFVREADSGRGRCTVSKNSWYSIPKLPKSPHQESDEPSHCGRCCERGYFWTSAYLLGLLLQSHDVAGHLVCTVLLLGQHHTL